MENTLASGSIALTDATFSTAIASCLEEAASDGLCTSYGFATQREHDAIGPDRTVEHVYFA